MILYLLDNILLKCFSNFFLFILALCSPACTLTTDTCDGSVSPAVCKCGTSAACGGDVLSNRCLSGTCVCGISAKCTTGTTVAVCLDQVGNTPGSSNTVATCKVSYIDFFAFIEQFQIHSSSAKRSQTFFIF